MKRPRLKKNPQTAAIKKEFGKLVDIMYTLRAEDGCPWDRAQSVQDLKQYLLEESYEVLQAIDQEDARAMTEEMGDLMLQVVFLSQIMQERGVFTLLEVLEHIDNKLIGRHQHVFGSVRARSAEEALDSWESAKRSEGSAEKGTNKRVLEGVPASLPALLQAHLISRKVVRVGFEWEKEEDVWKKLEEELREFREAKTPTERELEMGDILFTLVNIARKNNINAEDALRASNTKFRERFNKLEQRVIDRKQRFENLTLKELDEIWDDIKQQE